MPRHGNKAPKSESTPYGQPSWPPWFKTWCRLAGSTVLVLAFLCLLPANGSKPSPEWFLIRDLEWHINLYARDHHGLWPTNWAQMTNTFFRTSPRLYNQSLFLPDHYGFIPHDQNWEIKPHNRRHPLRIVMLRASPNIERGKTRPGRYAIVFSPSQNPDYREFEAEWFHESLITNLLARSSYSLPPAQKHDSRIQWLSERKQQRIALIGGIGFLALLLLTPIACLIGAYHFVKHQPIG